jgi:hypothetical protein
MRNIFDSLPQPVSFNAADDAKTEVRVESPPWTDPLQPEVQKAQGAQGTQGTQGTQGAQGAQEALIEPDVVTPNMRRARRTRSL